MYHQFFLWLQKSTRKQTPIDDDGSNNNSSLKQSAPPPLRLFPSSSHLSQPNFTFVSPTQILRFLPYSDCYVCCLFQEPEPISHTALYTQLLSIFPPNTISKELILYFYRFSKPLDNSQNPLNFFFLGFFLCCFLNFCHTANAAITASVSCPSFHTGLAMVEGSVF